jgi:hypothetical protein
MKQPTKTDSRPKAIDTLTAVSDLIIPYRYPEKIPTLGDVARAVAAAARTLHIDANERSASLAKCWRYSWPAAGRQRTRRKDIPSRTPIRPYRASTSCAHGSAARAGTIGS